MSTPAVDIEGVIVRFGDQYALRDVTFQAPPGSFVAILGPNGAGKSTLVKAILGLVTPTEGRVRVCGRMPERVDPAAVGYVPQVKTLDRTFPCRAFELVQTGLHRRWPLFHRGRDEAVAALARVQADHLADRQLASLSGGELQRVYLARALARVPRLVVLDEPATGVDATGTAGFYDLIEAYQRERGATVVMVTHDLSVASHHASHVLLLNNRQVSFGPPSRALDERCLREAYGHVGHTHRMSPNVH